MADQIAQFLRKPYYDMSEQEYDDAVNAMLKTVKYNMPITPEGDIEPRSRSGINARSMAELALDRGVGMNQPAGPNRTFTDQQYLDMLAQQPVTNKLLSPQQDIMKRGIFAQDMAKFKNELHQQTASPYYEYEEYLRNLLGL
jgi:hypothetical protein